MSTINYSLTPVSEEFTGGVKVFRATVLTNGTIGSDEIAAEIATRTKQSKGLVTYFLNSLNEVLEKKMVAGYRVNLDQLATGLAVKGSFKSEDDRWDSERHTLVATIKALDPLKSALAAVTPENIVVSLTCSVKSLMDFVTKELNAITGSNEVHIQGLNLGIDVDNPDESVTLVDDDGKVVATATVIESDQQTINCRFATPPAPGVYTLVVSARNGNRVTLAPAVAKLKDITFRAN